MEYLSAYELKDALAGYSKNNDFDVVGGSVPNGYTPILVGETSATTEKMPSGDQYLIKVEANGQIQICASNYYGYRAALARMQKELKANNGIYVGAYAGDANFAHAERPTDTSIRVMFSNVFGWNNWPRYDAAGNQLALNSSLVPPENLRQDLQRDLVGSYAPDVIGFQEYMSYDEWKHASTQIADYHGKFTAIMGSLGYAKVNAGGPDNNALKNTTPMFYNANKLTVLKSGFELFDDTQDTWQSKGVTWAIFKVEKGADAGEMFAVCNTHFSHKGDEEGNEFRAKNANELLGVIKNEILKGDYANIPVIMGGDLNYWNIWGEFTGHMVGAEQAALEKKAHQTLLDGGMKLASDLAGNATNYWKKFAPNDPYTNSYHGYYEYNTNGSYIYDMENSSLTRQKEDQYTLDHIYLYNEGNVTVQRHYIVEDDLTLRASDHCPTLIDFVLN